MIAKCDRYMLYPFRNFSSHVQDFMPDRKLGTSLFHDKLNAYVIFRDVVALFTRVLLYLNPKRYLRKEMSMAQFFRYNNILLNKCGTLNFDNSKPLFV